MEKESEQKIKHKVDNYRAEQTANSEIITKTEAIIIHVK